MSWVKLGIQLLIALPEIIKAVMKLLDKISEQKTIRAKRSKAKELVSAFDDVSNKKDTTALENWFKS